MFDARTSYTCAIRDYCLQQNKICVIITVTAMGEESHDLRADRLWPNCNQSFQGGDEQRIRHGNTSLYADLIDAIQDDRRPYVDAVAGRNALEIVLAIYHSQKIGQPVRLPLRDAAGTDMEGIFDRKGAY